MKLRYLSAAALILAAIAAPAAAQVNDQGLRQVERGYLIGFGGPASTVVTSPFFGVSGGVNVSRNVQIFGEIGRMQDLQAYFTRDDIAANEAEFLSSEGVPLKIGFEMPTVFTSGGVRIVMANTYRVHPYVSGGAGVARLAPKPSFVVAGVDMTSVMLQDNELSKVFETQVRPMAVVGGGVAFDVVKHFTVHAGYRYSRIFVDTNYLQDSASPHTHKGFNVHRVYAGAGFAF
jgi:opacity protein-like surface antigen